ncbi:hypothetical protein [Pseudoxanthomonas sp. X-1]|uniref:hypothetical protein n=1 Tax=Pseudoxanthomonas sp. X-1 TaxID=2571115 RepID=UPI00110C07C8|nr:hypothetical protein [Pseudoxanthomonas sp. X-1]TMN24530.1 hypothetical protein FF950_05480 [Pseudoxanthomonas sp. X-1]UAY75200.1 hypothetical protein LAJ50_02745 [Pseudoxanthomonas sp. X-1]
MSTDILKALRDEAAARHTPTGDFLPLSDKVTADLLESGAKEIEHQRQLVGGLIADMLCPPFISDTTRSLVEMLIQRDQAGRAKYGTTLDRTDLTQQDWLQHLIEEMLDGAGYALRAKQTAAALQQEMEDWRLQASHGTEVAHAAAERIAELEHAAPSWDEAPLWAKFLAMDADGEWGWFEFQPVKRPDMWDVQAGRFRVIRGTRYLGGWDSTLQARPEAST